jgi:hypothetical protein
MAKTPHIVDFLPSRLRPTIKLLDRYKAAPSKGTLIEWYPERPMAVHHEQAIRDKNTPSKRVSSRPTSPAGRKDRSVGLTA